MDNRKVDVKRRCLTYLFEGEIEELNKEIKDICQNNYYTGGQLCNSFLYKGEVYNPYNIHHRHQRVGVLAHDLIPRMGEYKKKESDYQDSTAIISAYIDEVLANFECIEEGIDNLFPLLKELYIPIKTKTLNTEYRIQIEAKHHKAIELIKEYHLLKLINN